MQDKCAVKDCKRKIYVKKHHLCQTHYIRYVRNGEINDKPIRPRKLIPKWEPTKSLSR